MGIIETKIKYKTKAIIEIFVWHIHKSNFGLITCKEIVALPSRFDCEYLTKENFKSLFSIPFELVATDDKVFIRNLQISFLLLSSNEQGTRVEVFKSLTTDPEELNSFLR